MIRVGKQGRTTRRQSLVRTDWLFQRNVEANVATFLNQHWQLRHRYGSFLKLSEASSHLTSSVLYIKVLPHFMLDFNFFSCD